jgi:hypothetical protein
MGDQSSGKRVLMAQGVAALAYFFFAHGAHAATPAQHAQAGVAPAHAAVVSIQPRRK